MKRIFVLGAGTMGAGIAEVAAKSAETFLYDVDAARLARAKEQIAGSLDKAVEKQKIDAAARDRALANLSLVTDRVAAANADLVIEAVPEQIELKKQLLSEIGLSNPHAVLASNTSSLSLTEIAAAVPDPGRVLGLHFFNPAPVMALIEVVRAEQTRPEILERALTWIEAVGKTAIVVADAPGFATSRLGIVLGMEAIRMLESGVASALDIDRAMSLGYRHPMGPLELTDLVGLDVRLSIAEHLTRELGPQFTPPPLLRKLVRAGKLGKKTGEGFYRWVDGKALPK